MPNHIDWFLIIEARLLSYIRENGTKRGRWSSMVFRRVFDDSNWIWKISKNARVIRNCEAIAIDWIAIDYERSSFDRRSSLIYMERISPEGGKFTWKLIVYIVNNHEPFFFFLQSINSDPLFPLFFCNFFKFDFFFRRNFIRNIDEYIYIFFSSFWFLFGDLWLMIDKKTTKRSINTLRGVSSDTDNIATNDRIRSEIKRWKVSKLFEETKMKNERV